MVVAGNSSKVLSQHSSAKTYENCIKLNKKEQPIPGRNSNRVPSSQFFMEVDNIMTEIISHGPSVGFFNEVVYCGELAPSSGRLPRIWQEIHGNKL
jgi:hypothetical protein